MVYRLFAVWLIGLTALPFTAPLSAFNAAEFMSHSGTCCGASIAHQASHASQENAAVSCDHSDLLTLSRLRPFVAHAYHDAHVDLPVLRPSLAPTIFPTDPQSSLKTVLRI